MNIRDVLRCDYTVPIPPYLRAARFALEQAVSADTTPSAKVAAGMGTLGDTLAAIWKMGLAQGANIWGSHMLEGWTQARYDDILYWSLRYNFALEATALSAMTALMMQDAALARQAIRANLIVLGSRPDHPGSESPPT